MQLALEFMKTYLSRKAEYCRGSYEAENATAEKLYQSFGFVETGDMMEKKKLQF